ncbi:MAG: hypothetical protein COV36_06350 [Alphaproteobacteria bacterium CG11_big_fil_rev_8_21_14_0_20_44_7]|nr:MAG: hypothetical protein COV36_06350 [Alphaproteobacteria bacterium CG11_big_fil_rev_8_21_14_0_20_44_7]
MVKTTLHTTAGDATVYNGDFGGAEHGSRDGVSWGVNTSTGMDMVNFPYSVALHNKDSRFHIVRVTNHDTGKSALVLDTNYMGNSESAGDTTPKLLEYLGGEIKYHKEGGGITSNVSEAEIVYDPNVKPLDSGGKNQEYYPWIAGDNAENFTFEIVGEMKVKERGDTATNRLVHDRLHEVSDKLNSGEITDPASLDLALGDDFKAVAELYPEFMGAIEEHGIAYKPDIKMQKGETQIARNGKINPTPEEAKRHLTADLEPQKANETKEEYKKREAEHVLSKLDEMSPDDAMFYAIIAAIFSWATGRDLADVLESKGDEVERSGGNPARHRNVARSVRSGDLEHDGHHRMNDPVPIPESPLSDAEMLAQVESLANGATGRVEKVGGRAMSKAMDDLNKEFEWTRTQGEFAVVIDLGHHTANHPNIPGGKGFGFNEWQTCFHQLRPYAEKIAMSGGAVYFTHSDSKVRKGNNEDGVKTDIEPRRDFAERIINGQYGGKGIMVSFHQNAMPEESPNGLEILANPNSSAYLFAKIAIEDFEKAGIVGSRTEGEPVGAMRNRGVKTDRIVGILKKSDVPVVIMETGFLSNRHDNNLITDKAFLDKTASSLALSTVRYAEQVKGIKLVPDSVEMAEKRKNPESKETSSIPKEVQDRVKEVMSGKPSADMEVSALSLEKVRVEQDMVKVDSPLIG